MTTQQVKQDTVRIYQNIAELKQINKEIADIMADFTKGL